LRFSRKLPYEFLPNLIFKKLFSVLLGLFENFEAKKEEMADNIFYKCVFEF